MYLGQAHQSLYHAPGTAFKANLYSVAVLRVAAHDIYGIQVTSVMCTLICMIFVTACQIGSPLPQYKHNCAASVMQH